MTKETECPFDGKHFSSMARAACPVCNPDKTVPELNAAAGALRTSRDVLLRAAGWLSEPAGESRASTLDLIERLARELKDTRAGLAACNQVLQQERERLTRELETQRAVVELAYIPHRSLVESRDRAEAEIARLRPMAESWESYEAAQDRKGTAEPERIALIAKNVETELARIRKAATYSGPDQHLKLTLEFDSAFDLAEAWMVALADCKFLLEHLGHDVQ